MAIDEGPVRGRLVVEPEARDGAWNMAFDEALLETAANRGEATLRVYRWAEPTLSLGYFQKSLPAGLPEALAGLPRVRRLSGGGAILHDREWTYSCCLPRRHPLAAKPETLYQAIHGAAIRAFAAGGVDAAMRGVPDRAADAQFLCFLRADPGDVLVAGRKVVGSAQRRRRGAVLQHGSVLLRRSPLAPDVPGLLDLIGSTGDDPWFGREAFVREAASLLLGPEFERGPAVADLTAASERMSAAAKALENPAVGPSER